MRINTRDMSLTLHADGAMEWNAGFPHGKFRPEILLDGAALSMADFTVAEQSEHHFVLTGKNEKCTWKYTAAVEGEKIALRLTAELTAPAKTIHLVPFTQNSFDPDHFLGQNMRMGGCVSHHFPCATADDFTAYHFVMIKKGSDFLMISTPLRNRFLTKFTGRAAGDSITGFRCAAVTEYEDSLRVDSGAFTFSLGQDPFRMMNEWSEENIEVKKDFSKVLSAGWNSWDYYRWTVTEKEVLENAEFIARDPVLSRHVKRIIVDDGWQYCYGEWDANPLFPNGMEYLAKELTKMGFEPGLWIAPSIVEPHARIAQINPQEMMALGKNGLPCLAYECMRRFGFVLDPTVEKSKKFIRDTFSRFSGMGYRYFKLDFLCSTLNAHQFHDRSVPRTDIVRTLVEQAYEGVAGRAVILGCNYAYSSGNQFVGAVRVGADIHARWENIRHNSVSVAGTMWAAEKHWINDPDFALCRSGETSDDPNLNDIRPLAVFSEKDSEYDEKFIGFGLVDAGLEQVKILLSLALVSSGALNLSDKMSRLNSKGLDLARRTVSAEHGTPGTPVDLFEGDLARVWKQKLAKGFRVLLINWDDVPKTMSFDLSANGISGTAAVNFWNDSAIDISAGKIETELPARSCLLAVVNE